MIYTHYDIKNKGDKELLRRCKNLRASIYKDTKNEFMKCGLSRSKKMMLLMLYHLPVMYPIFKRAFELD